MAESGTIVYAVGLQYHAGKLLHDVVIFIGGLGRREAAKLLRLVGFEFFRDQLVGFAPGGFNKDSILLYQWPGEAVLAVDELMGVPSLLAELALINRRAVPRLYCENPVVPHDEIKTASYTAVRAGGWNKFQINSHLHSVLLVGYQNPKVPIMIKVFRRL
jgi:hypothetical protein